MADQRTFTLIGAFDDRITPSLEKINKSIDALKKNLADLTNVAKPLKNEFKDLADLSKTFSTSLKGQATDIKEITAAMRAMRNEMGRVNRAYRAAGRNRNIVPPPPPPPRPPRTTLPPPPPPPRVPRTPQYPAGGGRGGRGGYNQPPRPRERGGRESVLGDVISGSLISNAIIQGFQTGVGILQQGMSAAFGAFAERSRDQLEDIAAAGGIFSAAKFAGAKGLPTKFQDAMEMQDRINKQMAAIASNLPGTTHDYVENSRRLVDTTAQIMSRDFESFTKLAQDLTGKMNMSAEEAFTTVNVEIAKATTLLEKMNPSRTVVPMTQIVEDLLKQETVSIGGLRKYVAFRRGTTFEASLTRNLEEMNKAGAGTADRLKMIIKVLKEAVPVEMINVFQTSVNGVVEGFKSAFTDPDVGLFGLSRQLTFEVDKFDRETGRKIGKEFSNFFRMFSEVFGNIGNLINTAILPGLSALYQPFDGLAKTIERLRTYSFKIFERQQEYTKHFEDLAGKYGMRREDFKVFEKGGVSVLMDILQGFNMLDDAKYRKIVSKMEQKGTPEQIAQNMKEIYADIIPAIFESPFFKNIGTTIGKALAEVFKEIAKIMKALLKGDYGVSQFTQAFYDAGGMDAINEILMYVAEGLGKLLMGIAQTYMGALAKAIGSGNFAAAGVLGALGLVFGAPAIAGIQIIAKGMNLLVGAFRFLLGSNIKPAKVRDLGSTTPIRDPRRMLPAAKDTLAVSPAADEAARVVKGGWFSKLFANLKNFGRLITTPIKAFGKFNIAIMALVGAIEFVSTLLSGGNIAEALGKAAGPAIGMAIGGALLGPLGAMIGGWLGSLKPVTDSLTGIFQGLWWGISQAWQAIGPALDGIGGILVTVFNGIIGLIPGLDSLASNFDFLNFAFIGVKIALFPFVSAINGVAVALQLLKLGLLNFDKWVNSTFQFGDRQGRIQAEIDKTNVQIQKIAENQTKINSSLLKPLPAQKPAAPGAAKPPTAPSPVFATPAAPIVPSAPPVTPPEVKQTAQSTASIDAKSTTHLATAAATRQMTAKTTQNTTTANTHLISIKSAAIAISNKLGSLQSAILGDLNNIQAGVTRISSLLASGSLKVKTDAPAFPGFPGGVPMGGAQGNLGAAQQLASSNGLQLTSWFRPGDRGMHGVGRAMDFSNGVNTPQQMAFAQQMIARYGSSLAELIYTPLGFGIKNGQKVPLSYWGEKTNAMHYNHVHVAFAEGKENGKMFTSQEAAGGWEKSMVPGSVKIASVTANSGDGGGFGSMTFGDINVTVNAAGVSDADELASIVAIKIGEAVADARAASIFV